MATMSNVARRILVAGKVLQRFEVTLRVRRIDCNLIEKRAPLTSRSQRHCLHTTCTRLQESENLESEDQVEEEVTVAPPRPVHDVETSKRYMASKAYAMTYGDGPVWVPYRRNHKGRFPPETTRKTCIRGKVMAGNPCPVCRDEYLVLDSAHPDLLEQFISKQTGEVLSFKKTGLCQKQHRNLLVEVEKAWDIGTIQKPLPFKSYDYAIYYPDLKTGDAQKQKQ